MEHWRGINKNARFYVGYLVEASVQALNQALNQVLDQALNQALNWLRIYSVLILKARFAIRPH